MSDGSSEWVALAERIRGFKDVTTVCFEPPDNLSDALGVNVAQLVRLVELVATEERCRPWRRELDRRAYEAGWSIWGPAQRAAKVAVQSAFSAAADQAHRLIPQAAFQRHAYCQALAQRGALPESTPDLDRHNALLRTVDKRVLIEAGRDFGYAEHSRGAEPWASLARLWAAGFAPVGVADGVLYLWPLPGGAS